jgi:hypothetical protein
MSLSPTDLDGLRLSEAIKLSESETAKQKKKIT